jgi:hypothetical protein
MQSHKILPASFWNKKRAEECAGIDPNSIQLTVEEKAAEAARLMKKKKKRNSAGVGGDTELRAVYGRTG